MKEIERNICERADDLVAFLYGELSDIEARKFERHLRDCSSCERELASFGALRSSIVAWRDESLGAVSHGVSPAAVPAALPPERPSALAALREFFRLSPLWMKGATAFASVLFCVLATLAVFNVVKKPNPPSPTLQSRDAEGFKAEVARLKEENALLQSKLDQPRKDVVMTKPAPEQLRRNNPVPAGSAYARNQSRNLRRPLSRQERMELAADLRLLSSKEDDDLDLGSEVDHP